MVSQKIEKELRQRYPAINREILEITYECIAAIHANVPELRVGQLMYNFAYWLEHKKGRDIFYLSDTNFINLLSEYCHSMQYEQDATN